jgi:hypothetical protein
MSDAPIGVFDSGVGGLTVARAILDQLPHEPLLYFGDTTHAPYGPRPIAEVRRLALDAMDTLVAEGVKLLVIACNTASAACLRDARERYDVPVVEVVLPAARRAVAATRSGRVGVIGTVATITSRAYDDAVAAAADVTLTSVACPAFVDFVERGTTAGRQLLGLAEAYLAPLQEADVDTVADRGYWARDGGKCHPGEQRRGDSKGHLPGVGPWWAVSRSRTPATGSSVSRHRRPALVHQDRPQVPRARAGGRTSGSAQRGARGDRIAGRSRHHGHARGAPRWRWRGGRVGRSRRHRWRASAFAPEHGGGHAGTGRGRRQRDDGGHGDG